MTSRLASVTGALALGLILYLPVEPGFLSIVPGQLFWFLRLAPDALIVAVAAGLVLGELRSPSLQARLLILIAGTGVAIVVLDAARGFAVVDTVNALRVVLRYPILGIALWRHARSIPRFPGRLLGAVLVAGLVQLVAGIGEIVIRLANPMPLGLNGLWFIEGTTGRYDRFGFSMAALGIVILLRVRDHVDRRLLVAFGIGTGLLALTTSRQALLALAVAALVQATGRLVWRHRLSLLAISAVLVLMISLVPSTIPVLRSTSDQNSPSAGNADDRNPEGTRSGTVVIQAYKGATELSINPNRNFRVYLNLVLMPWAAAQEPLLGFGPQQQVNPAADSRLRNFVASAGMDWAYATNFIGDSNYASLVIQFGFLFPVMLFAGLGYLARSAFRASRSPGWQPLQQFAFAVAAAFSLAAVFGPAFEQRISSSLLWISLFTAFAFRSQRA